LPMLVIMSFGYTVFDPYAMADRGIRYAPDLWSTSDYALFHWLLYFSGIFILFAVTYSGLVFMSARFYLGADPPLAEIIKFVFRRFGAVFSVGVGNLLFGLAMIGVPFSISVLLFLTDELGSGFAVGLFISTPIAIVLIWFVYARYGLSMVTAVCDDDGATEAFPRSSYLTTKYRGRVVALIAMALLVVGGPFNTGLMSLGGLLIKNMLEGVDKHLLGDALRLCWFALCIPLMITPFVVMFYDMICRKENYDLAVMAQEFGISQAQMDEFRFDSTKGYLPKGYRRNAVGARKMTPPPAPVQPVPHQLGQPQMNQQAWGMQGQMPQMPNQQPMQQGWGPQPQMPSQPPMQQGWPQQGQMPMQPQAPRMPSPRGRRVQ
ncbi:MAG: hypothetical protein V3V10_04435, partial [Planctomycetota bacterium]